MLDKTFLDARMYIQDNQMELEKFRQYLLLNSTIFDNFMKLFDLDPCDGPKGHEPTLRVLPSQRRSCHRLDRPPVVWNVASTQHCDWRVLQG
jgi:hypothetical protein